MQRIQRMARQTSGYLSRSVTFIALLDCSEILDPRGNTCYFWKKWVVILRGVELSFALHAPYHTQPYYPSGFWPEILIRVQGNDPICSRSPHSYPSIVRNILAMCNMLSFIDDCVTLGKSGATGRLEIYGWRYYRSPKYRDCDGSRQCSIL